MINLTIKILDLRAAEKALGLLVGDTEQLADDVQRAAITIGNRWVNPYLSIPGTWQSNPVGRGNPGLHVVTGNLRRSIAFGPRLKSGNMASISIGTNEEYAPYHEFGFHGSMTIGAHLRRCKSRNVKEGRKIVAKGIAFVKQHTRKVNYPGHPTLVPAIEDQMESVKDLIISGQARRFQAAIDAFNAEARR